MIIEKMIYMKNKGAIYANLLFLKMNAKHTEQEYLKIYPKKTFWK